MSMPSSLAISRGSGAGASRACSSAVVASRFRFLARTADALDGVGAEGQPAGEIEAVECADQADRPGAHQFVQLDGGCPLADGAGDVMYETEVAIQQLVACGRVAVGSVA